MTVEYQMTLEQEIKIQPLLVFLFNKKKTLSAIISALLCVVGFILSATVSTLFAIPSVVLLLFSVHMFLYWIRRTRVRSQKMANLYRFQESKVLTYTLSERDGVIRDYCNELKTGSEKKRSSIKRIFSHRGLIIVTFFSGDISVYPDTESIRNFFKG